MGSRTVVALSVLIAVFTIAGSIVFIAIVASGKREDEMRAHLIEKGDIE